MKIKTGILLTAVMLTVLYFMSGLRNKSVNMSDLRDAVGDSPATERLKKVAGANDESASSFPLVLYPLQAQKQEEPDREQIKTRLSESEWAKLYKAAQWVYQNEKYTQEHMGEIMVQHEVGHFTQHRMMVYCESNSDKSCKITKIKLEQKEPKKRVSEFLITAEGNEMKIDFLVKSRLFTRKSTLPTNV